MRPSQPPAGSLRDGSIRLVTGGRWATRGKALHRLRHGGQSSVFRRLKRLLDPVVGRIAEAG